MIDKPLEIIPKITSININKLAKSNESLENVERPSVDLDRFEGRFSSGKVAMGRSDSGGSAKSVQKRDVLDSFVVMHPGELLQLLATQFDGQCLYNNEPTAILLIDLRCVDKFDSKHLTGSINPQFPTLLIKRFKKRTFSNFNILNFLQNKSQHQLVSQWKAGLSKKLIVVYAENFTDYDTDSDVWAILNALNEGMANELHSSVSYVDGGFSGILSTTGIEKYLTIDLNEKAPSPSSNTQPPRMGEITIATQQRVSERGPLSIDVTSAKKRIGAPTLSITRSPANDLMSATTERSAVTSVADSATEQSFPAHPFSFITENLIVGSDEIPQSATGPSKLHDIGVTHILNMASEIKHTKLLHDSKYFQLKWIPVHDNTEVDLDDALNEAIAFMGSILLTR